MYYKLFIGFYYVSYVLYMGYTLCLIIILKFCNKVFIIEKKEIKQNYVKFIKFKSF